MLTALVILNNSPQLLNKPPSLNIRAPVLNTTITNSQVTFKVFVILETGNEAGSAAMTVERPE